MTDRPDNSSNPSDDMSEYLQTFLDETEEQLDDLVETLLALEQDAQSQDDLNEAFRLIHSIKGSAGMMGFDNITVLTHHLENRFERFRSGAEALDQRTMNLVLRCIDFLRQCNERLRDGEELGGAADLLDELRRLEEEADQADDNAAEPEANHVEPPVVATPADPPRVDAWLSDAEDVVVMRIAFRAGLQLVDLKAQLIVARLEDLGELKATHPNLETLAEADQLQIIELHIDTHETLERLRAAADVDGVETVEFVEPATLAKGQPLSETPELVLEDDGSVPLDEDPDETPAIEPKEPGPDPLASLSEEPAFADDVEEPARDVEPQAVPEDDVEPQAVPEQTVPAIVPEAVAEAVPEAVRGGRRRKARSAATSRPRHGESFRDHACGHRTARQSHELGRRARRESSQVLADRR